MAKLIIIVVQIVLQIIINKGGKMMFKIGDKVRVKDCPSMTGIVVNYDGSKCVIQENDSELYDDIYSYSHSDLILRKDNETNN